MQGGRACAHARGCHDAMVVLQWLYGHSESGQGSMP